MQRLRKTRRSDYLKFDKATEKWFREHLCSETAVMKCDKCGLFYKPILGHTCKMHKKAVR